MTKKRIKKMVKTVKKAFNVKKLNLGLVVYRDYTDKNMTLDEN
jgi:hypothetical protein